MSLELTFDFDYQTHFNDFDVDIPADFSTASSDSSWIYGETSRVQDDNFDEFEYIESDHKFSSRYKAISEEGEMVLVKDANSNVFLIDLLDCYRRASGDSLDGVQLRYRQLRHEPSDLSISASTFDENIVSGSAVATLSSTDEDSGDSHSYALVSGAGDTDNDQFTIDGDQLKINASPDYETKDSYSIRLQTTDSGGQTLEKAFTLTVNDLNEDPTPEPNDNYYDLPKTTNSIAGTNKKNNLKGTRSNDYILGLGGNDKLNGKKGDDILEGGDGNDKIKGKGGKDLFICLYGRDIVKDYDSDEGDSIQVNGEFIISKKKKHSLIEHEGGSVLVKKTNPEDVEVEGGETLESVEPNTSENTSDYLELAKESSIPRKKGNILGTWEDDIIEVQRYYEQAYIYDIIRIGMGSDLLVFDIPPSYRVNRNGVEKLDSSSYWLSEFDPLTGDKLLFDSAFFNKYDNALATARSIEGVYEIAQSSTSFILYDDILYYNENGSANGLSIDSADEIDWWDAKFILFDRKNANLESLSQAIEFI